MEPKVLYHCSKDGYGELFEEVNDAVESFLDDLSNEEFQKYCKQNQDVSVYIYTQAEPHQMSSDRLLDFILEYMDEDYLADHMDGTDPTDTMIVAAELFLAVVHKEFPRRAYSLSTKNQPIAIKALDWVEENAPHWLKQGQVVSHLA